MTGLAVVASAPFAWAEEPSSSNGSRTAAYFQSGFSTASPHVSGAVAGGSLLLRVGRRLALEGSGAYVGRGAGSAAASLSASLLWHLAPLEEEAVPYFVLGGGLYRASFDTRSARFSGPAPSGEMRSGRFTHTMEGGPPGWDLGELPRFYGERVADVIAREGRIGSRSFNDPALSLGAGMRVRIGRGWSMRPDARAQLVVRDGDVYALTAFTIQVGRGF